MKIDIMPLYGKIPVNHLANSTVIMVDVLRATSCIITAVKNGSQRIIPAIDAGEAAALALRLDSDDCVLAGENNCLKLPDFDIGNSPYEFTPDIVKDKVVIMATTNGTAAINSMKSAKNLLIGAMINRTAVAKRALELDDDVIIVCAGTDDRISADDLCAAGAITDAICRLSDNSAELSDIAMVCRILFSDWQSGSAQLDSTFHYSRLVRLGFTKDIEYCFTTDSTDVVPVLRDGIITE